MNIHIATHLSWASSLPEEHQLSVEKIKTAPMTSIFRDLLSDFTAEDVYRARLKHECVSDHLSKGHPNPYPVAIWKGRVLCGHETILCALDLGISEILAYIISEQWNPDHASACTKAWA